LPETYKQIVYSGGGSPNALTKCSPEEINRINKAVKADLIVDKPNGFKPTGIK
jgi:hypothetical protein